MRVSSVFEPLCFGAALALAVLISVMGCGKKCSEPFCASGSDPKTAATCGTKIEYGIIICTHINDDCVGYNKASCHCDQTASGCPCNKS
jgi:hypothetical protein